MKTDQTITKNFTRSFVEGTGRGYIVGVVLEGGRKVDLAAYRHDGTVKGIDAAYASASGSANSIKRGRFVSRYTHGVNHTHVCMVNGNVLTLSPV